MEEVAPEGAREVRNLVETASINLPDEPLPKLSNHGSIGCDLAELLGFEMKNGLPQVRLSELISYTLQEPIVGEN
jgi:hypothetical protein